MDWKSFSEHFDTMTCVISVEKKPDGKCGTVRIVTGNRKYLDSLDLRPGMDLREALAEADTRMYQDKEAYYREHPEMNRRTL